MRIVQRVSVHHCGKFRVDQSNHCCDIAICSKWRASPILDLLCMFGPPTTSIWWHLSLCKIWLDSMQFSLCSFDNMQLLIYSMFGLKIPNLTSNGGFGRDFTP